MLKWGARVDKRSMTTHQGAQQGRQVGKKQLGDAVFLRTENAMKALQRWDLGDTEDFRFYIALFGNASPVFFLFCLLFVVG